MRYFVTAIGTDSGKTLASAILCKALGAEYWKPIQSGSPTDSDTIRELCPEIKIHPEAYRLEMPASPHAAAAAEGVLIQKEKIQAPNTAKPLVIEGAGGCLVPLNDADFVIDLVPQLNAEVVLVANLYLGSINHTLLTAQLLQQRGYPVAGIIFNGPANADSQQIILKHTGYKQLLHIQQHTSITSALLHEYAEQLKLTLRPASANR